jgi:outer membrane protein assembly factor BamB
MRNVQRMSSQRKPVVSWFEQHTLRALPSSGDAAIARREPSDLQTQNGALRWSHPVDGNAFNNPLLMNAAIYLSADNGVIYALSAENGAAIWQYRA